MLMYLQVANWCTASSLAKPEALVFARAQLALRAPAVTTAKDGETRPLVFRLLFVEVDG
jgi:hypothetical protein